MGLCAASKCSLLGFSRALHRELKETNVSVPAVSPGVTDRDFVVRAQVGAKALKAADKVNMSPQAVAKIVVKVMFNKKPEVIIGLINKAGAFITWLLSKGLIERTAMRMSQQKKHVIGCQF